MTTDGPSRRLEPLLERDGELRAVSQLLADAKAGRGQLQFVEGAAGIGKSSLLERATLMAREQGFLVLRAQGREMERALGWGIARGLFESLLQSRSDRERDELLSGPATPSRVLFEPAGSSSGVPAAEVGFEILHGLYWLALRIAEKMPLVLVIDDAHWADEPSIRFLAYLAARLPDQPIGVLVASRPGAADLLAPLRGDPATRMTEPEPLSSAAVTELARRQVPEADEEFCQRCFELTGGNPLQMHELVSAIARGGARELSDLGASVELAARSLSRQVLRRLSSQSESAQALARAVAVFEGGVPLHRAADLAGLSPADGFAAADELARAEILDGKDPVGFVHPLLRETVYRAMPRVERAATHSHAAKLLAAEGATSEQVCAHLIEAPPAGERATVDLLRRGARSAIDHGVPSSAVAYLRRAIVEPPDGADRPWVLGELGRAEIEAGTPEAVDHLEAATGLMTEPAERARLRLDSGLLLHARGNLDDACAAFQRGLDDVGVDGGELALDLEAGYLTAAMISPRHAARAHRRVTQIIDRAADAVTPAERRLASKALLMRCWNGGRREEMARVARSLFADGRLIAEGGIESFALWDVIAILSFCDDYESAERALALTATEAVRRGSVFARCGVCIDRARLGLWTGPVPDAVEDASAAMMLLDIGIHAYVPISVYYLVCGALELGLPEQAEEALSRTGDHAHAAGWSGAYRSAAEGHLAAYRGDQEHALGSFLEAGNCLDQVLVTNPAVLPWRSEAGLCAFRLGLADQAHELISEERALAEKFGAPRAVGVAARASGLIERSDDAVPLLEAATEVLARCGARVDHARALADLGAAVRRAGRPKEARATLQGAIRIADELGAVAIARNARDELVRAGGRRPANQGGDGDLTPSERRVVELAAAGHTNREIANELFVTVKAVEWHLGNAYRKLDVRGRGDLASKL